MFYTVNIAVNERRTLFYGGLYSVIHVHDFITNMIYCMVDYVNII